MGETNRRKFESLLDEIESDTVQQEDQWSSIDIQENNETTDRVQDRGYVEVNEASYRLTDYNTAWNPLTGHSIGENLLQKTDTPWLDKSEIELPSSSNPTPEEVGRFFYFLGECSNVLLPEKADPGQISISDITSNPRFFRFNDEQKKVLDRIKLVASILENHNVPWIVSEVTAKHLSWDNTSNAIIEAGIPDGSDSHDEFVEAVRSTVCKPGAENKVNFIESTVNKQGYQFYPVLGTIIDPVASPGVFCRDEVIANGSDIHGIVHRGPIKTSFPEQ